MDVMQHWPAAKHEPTGSPLFAYSNAVLIAIAVAFLSVAGVEVRSYFEKKSWSFDWGRLEIASWSVISHILVAVVVFSMLNVIRIAGRRTRRPQAFSLALIGLSVFILLWVVLVGFLNSALTFEGWAAHLYAASLAGTLTLLLVSLVLPFLTASQAYPTEETGKRRGRFALVTTALGASLFAVALPTVIGGGDWNGVLQHAFTIFFWITLSVCIYNLRPRQKNYTVVTILTVLILTGFAYKGSASDGDLLGETAGLDR